MSSAPKSPFASAPAQHGSGSAEFGSRADPRASTFCSLADPRASTRRLAAEDPAADPATLNFERVTGFLSAACAIHCLLTPLALALLPLMGTSGAALGGTSELLLSALVLISGTASLVLGFRRHRDVRLAAIIGACLVLYSVGHAHEAAWYGATLSVLAGLGLAAASFWSARLGHLHNAQCAH